MNPVDVLYTSEAVTGVEGLQELQLTCFITMWYNMPILNAPSTMDGYSLVYQTGSNLKIIETRLPFSRRKTTRKHDTQTCYVITRSVCGIGNSKSVHPAGWVQISNLKSSHAVWRPRGAARSGSVVPRMTKMDLSSLQLQLQWDCTYVCHRRG